MSWTRKDLLEAASRYQRELKGRAGEHYAALAAEEARRFVDWLGGEAGGSAAPRARAAARARTGGWSAAEDRAARPGLDRQEGPSQHASTWIRSAWSAMLPEHEDLLDACRTSSTGRLVRGHRGARRREPRGGAAGVPRRDGLGIRHEAARPLPDSAHPRRGG